MLVIAALAIGLAITCGCPPMPRSGPTNSAMPGLSTMPWPSRRSPRRDVLEAESAPALPTPQPGHDPVTGHRTPRSGPGRKLGCCRPAEACRGAPPPPLNTKLPDENLSVPPNGAPPVAAKPKPGSRRGGTDQGCSSCSGTAGYSACAGTVSSCSARA